jgi:hypothetical protein
MYFDAIRMPVDQFRAAMSAALVAIGLVRGLAYFGLGEFTADAWLLLAITFPMMLIGIYLGNRLFAELSEMRFRRLVSLILIVSGFALSATRVFHGIAWIGSYRSTIQLHGDEQCAAWRHTSATRYLYRRQRSCDRTGNANRGELYHVIQFACGSVLLRPSSRIIKWGLSLALGTEADRVAGNAFPSRLHRSSELDARCRYRARLAAGRHRHHSSGTPLCSTAWPSPLPS